jgi:hypothetical protein
MSASKETHVSDRYELWKSAKEGYSFFPEGNDSARRLLPSDATLVTVIVARSWEEAQTKKHEYLGLEPYKPMK